MKKPTNSFTEMKCSACDGTGFPPVKKPAKPGVKVYPPPCSACAGKGRITTAGTKL